MGQGAGVEIADIERAVNFAAKGIEQAETRSVRCFAELLEVDEKAVAGRHIDPPGLIVRGPARPSRDRDIAAQPRRAPQIAETEGIGAGGAAVPIGRASCRERVCQYV